MNVVQMKFNLKNKKISEKKKPKHNSKEEKEKETNVCRISPKNTSLNLRIPQTLSCYSQSENQHRVVSFCDLVW